MWPLSAIDVLQQFGGKLFSREQQMSLEVDLAQSIFGISTDSRSVLSDEFFLAIKGDVFDGHNFVNTALQNGAPFAIVNQSWTGIKELSPEQQARCVLVNNTLSAYRQFAQFFRRRFTFPVVAVAGSNGKTTTKELLAAILRGSSKVNSGCAKVTYTAKSENGFLGLAKTLTQRAHLLAEPPEFLVLEIGIDETGAMQQHVQLATPEIAMLTCLGPEHLAGLGSWENAAKEEWVLFEAHSVRARIWQLEDEKTLERLDQFGAKNSVQDIGVLLVDSMTLANNQHLQKNPHVLQFKVDNTHNKQTLLSFPFATQLALQNCSFAIPLPGSHNAKNLALALAAASHLGLSASEISQGLKTFIPPAMRSHLSLFADNILLYDDSYNSSPASLNAALRTINEPNLVSQNLYLVLGDMLDLGTETETWHKAAAEDIVVAIDTFLCQRHKVSCTENRQKVANNPRITLDLVGNAMRTAYNKMLQSRKIQSWLESDLLTLRWLNSVTEAVTTLKMAPLDLTNTLVMIKGSRGVGLDLYAHEISNLVKEMSPSHIFKEEQSKLEKPTAEPR